MSAYIEDVGRYIDGTLQDDVHARDVVFKRVPNSGRSVVGGWARDREDALEDANSLLRKELAKTRATALAGLEGRPQ